MNEPADRLNPRTLLTDLESRQEELLRMLDELEERTKAALARLSIHAPPADTKAA